MRRSIRLNGVLLGLLFCLGGSSIAGADELAPTLVSGIQPGEIGLPNGGETGPSSAFDWDTPLAVAPWVDLSIQRANELTKRMDGAETPIRTRTPRAENTWPLGLTSPPGRPDRPAWSRELRNYFFLTGYIPHPGFMSEFIDGQPIGDHPWKKLEGEYGQLYYDPTTAALEGGPKALRTTDWAEYALDIYERAAAANPFRNGNYRVFFTELNVAGRSPKDDDATSASTIAYQGGTAFIWDPLPKTLDKGRSGGGLAAVAALRAARIELDRHAPHELTHLYAQALGGRMEGPLSEALAEYVGHYFSADPKSPDIDFDTVNEFKLEGANGASPEAGRFSLLSATSADPGYTLRGFLARLEARSPGLVEEWVATVAESKRNGSPNTMGLHELEYVVGDRPDEKLATALREFGGAVSIGFAFRNQTINAFAPNLRDNEPLSVRALEQGELQVVHYSLTETDGWLRLAGVGPGDVLVTVAEANTARVDQPKRLDPIGGDYFIPKGVAVTVAIAPELKRLAPTLVFHPTPTE